MRTALWCVLVCLVSSGCATPAGPCEGPLQPVNVPAQSKSVQTPASAEPDGSIP
jgi:hypothetical protein